MDISKWLNSITNFGSDPSTQLNNTIPLAESGYEGVLGGTEGSPSFMDTISQYGMGANDGGTFGGLFSDSGLLSKDNLSAGGDLMGMATGAMGMYNSYKDRGMMEDMIDYGKDTANRNLSNQAILINDRLKNQARAQNALTNSNSYQAVQVDGSPIR